MSIFIGGRPVALRLVITILAVVTFLVSAAGVSAQTADPLAVLQQFITARNAGDEVEAMALVADNMSYVGGPVCTLAKPCVGRAIAQTLVVEQFYQKFHAHLTIIGTPQVTGNRVTARVESIDDRTRAAGVSRTISNLTVQVVDGKIASWAASLDPSDPQTARFLAVQQTRVTSTPSTLPATGDGGPLASRPLALLVGSILLAFGLTARRALSVR